MFLHMVSGFLGVQVEVWRI